MERFSEILDARRLTNHGPWVERFESMVADQTGTHAVAVCNATVGLQITARALDLKGEIIMPSFTFVGTAHAFEWIGLTPVFCDIDESTHTIDAAQAGRLIGPDTAAIVGVHLWGRPCDIQGLTTLAKEHDTRLILDAAQAFGSSFQGTHLGGFGDAEVFSFHATKVANTFEGGVICTRDAELAQALRQMRDFGFVAYDSVAGSGTNGKLSELGAAMGVTSLESLDHFITHNKANYLAYSDALKDVPGVHLLAHDGGEPANHQYAVCEIEAHRSGMTRDQLQQVLWAEGVHCRRYFYPGCHRLEPYVSNPNRSELHVTERVADRVLCLPTGADVTPESAAEVAQLLRLSLANAERIRPRLVRVEHPEP